MAAVSVTFAVGSEQATVVLPVDLPTGGETILTGDIGGLVAAGTVARLRGNVRLIDNLHVRGTLVCDPTGVNLDGQNLFDIHTHDGTLNLIGAEKTAWCRWGDIPVGWQTGDRLAVSPTAVGVFLPYEVTWQGSWAATPRPANSADVTLVDGSTARPEVANLSQTVTLRNLKRIMFHEASAPNPQTLKWVRVLNSGETGVLTNYPIHFHLLHDYSRGSLLEGVVVEGGKNHAFVPHGSHGITQIGCVAYNTIGNAYWWDKPILGQLPPVNDSDDLIWDQCLAMLSKNSPAETESTRLCGFSLGAGANVACINSVATAIAGNPNAGSRERSGFQWPESAARSSWLFQNCVAHNCGEVGLFGWQNVIAFVNLLEDFTAYNNGWAGIAHGAYSNRYHYRGATLTGTGLKVKAKTPDQGGIPLTFEDILSDAPLYILEHASVSMNPSFYRRVTVPQVIYDENNKGSYNVFEDCGLTPSMFNLTAINPESVIDVKEGGVLLHHWELGAWS